MRCFSLEIEKKKLRTLVLLILVLVISITAMLAVFRIFQAASKEREMSRLKMEMVSEMLNNSEERLRISKDWFRQNIDVNVVLMCYTLEEFLTEDGYDGPRVFEDGMVVEVRDNTILYPDELEDDYPEVTLAMLEEEDAETDLDTFILIRDEDGALEPDQRKVSVCIGEIGNGFYYVDWTTAKEYQEYTSGYTKREALLAAVEKSLNIGILVVDADSEDLKLLSPSVFFPDVSSAAELGITPEDLDTEGSLIRIGSRLYHCLYQKLPLLEMNLIYLAPFTVIVRQSISTAAMVAAVILLILVTISTWILSAREYVRRMNISKDREKIEQLRPQRVRRKTITAGITGTVAVFLFAMIIQSLTAMQSETEDGRETMNVLFSHLQVDEQQQLRELEKLETDWFVYYGQRLASLIGKYPQLGTRDNLEMYCLVTGADYIMLFDTEGRETVCSEGYTGFHLDSCFGENSEDFMKLLNGIPLAVRDPGIDNLTKKKSQLVGVCIPQGEGFGALVMSIQPEWISRVDLDDDINTRLDILTPEGRSCFAAEEESGLIRYASDKFMIGCTVEECGLPAETLRDSFTDFVTLNNIRSYAVTMEMEPLICYCSMDTGYLFSQIRGFALASALASAFALLVTIRFLLNDYTQERFEEWIRTEKTDPPASGRAPAPREGKRGLTSLLRESGDAFSRAVKKPLYWEEAGPEKRTGIVFRISLFLLILFCAVYVSSLSESAPAERAILPFILNGNWMRGFNLFAVCSILILCSGAYIFMAVLRYFLKLISSFTGRRGETVCRLFRSVMQYVVLLSLVYFSFSYLGFSPGTIVASVGVTALVLTLGARDMVTDTLAGIFIVLEDQFQVGDIISIEDYRGVVKEIGIRSVKVLGPGQDIRIFNNSNITGVTNKSRYLSSCVVNIRISATEPYSHVLEVLNRELPEIGARCDKIVGTPSCSGVTDFAAGFGAISVGVIAQCKEEDILYVRKILSNELALLCEREHIELH